MCENNKPYHLMGVIFIKHQTVLTEAAGDVSQLNARIEN